MSSEPDPTNPGNSFSPAPLIPPPAEPARVGDTGARATDRIVVYRHSSMFYWWPVWALGFLFALVTYFDNQHLAVVPDKTIAYENVKIELDGKEVVRSVLVLDEKKEHAKRKDADDKLQIVQPSVFITHYRALGGIYVIVLLFVITITNISIRGLWTVFFMVTILMLAIIIAAGGWWDNIFDRINQLSIYINMGGYLLISIVLFILWIINFAILDRQTHMIFIPGQLRVRIEIGGEETVYDVAGMVVQRQRADLFRHWILGFGSGDLIVKPVGLSHPIEFANVLNVTSVVAKIETMVKEKVIVRGPEQKSPNA